jgi:hypothetical protein
MGIRTLAPIYLQISVDKVNRKGYIKNMNNTNKTGRDEMKIKVIKERIAVNPWKDQRKSGWKIFCDAKCAEDWGAPLHIQQAVTDYKGAKCDQCKTIFKL